MDSENNGIVPLTNNDGATQTGPGDVVEASSEVDEAIRNLDPDTFKNWWQECQVAENIRNGQPYFNGASPVPPAHRHSPNKLLRCNRQVYYSQENAPEESDDPSGIFWAGSRFEEDVIVPFLEQEVITADQYVTNSIWVDFFVSTDVGDLRVKGATDPVIVTPDYDPVLLTEIKTKRSLDGVEQPNKHHKAQAHAYMQGLSEKFEEEVREAVLLYGSRTTFDITPFYIQFDPEFWRETVVEWAAQHTSYRVNGTLPPANPEYAWECEFCSYAERCGMGEREFEDESATGLLPLFTEYPREKVTGYLDSHSNAKLTPALAYAFPDLAEEHAVHDWSCRGCGETYEWQSIEWHPSNTRPPHCPACEKHGERRFLSGPRPGNQQPLTGGAADGT